LQRPCALSLRGSPRFQAPLALPLGATPRAPRKRQTVQPRTAGDLLACALGGGRATRSVLLCPERQRLYAETGMPVTFRRERNRLVTTRPRSAGGLSFSSPVFVQARGRSDLQMLRFATYHCGGSKCRSRRNDRGAVCRCAAHPGLVSLCHSRVAEKANFHIVEMVGDELRRSFARVGVQGFRGRWKRRCILHSRKGHLVERSIVA
jgi:hypothetical protein